jgi:hypothetical protein
MTADQVIFEEVLDKPIPNVVVEWLALLRRIWEVSGSNLGRETDYRD